MGSASALIEQRDNPAMTFRHISPVADDVTDYAKDDVAHDDEAHHFGDGEIWAQLIVSSKFYLECMPVISRPDF